MGDKEKTTTEEAFVRDVASLGAQAAVWAAGKAKDAIHGAHVVTEKSVQGWEMPEDTTDQSDMSLAERAVRFQLRNAERLGRFVGRQHVEGARTVARGADWLTGGYDTEQDIADLEADERARPAAEMPVGAPEPLAKALSYPPDFSEVTRFAR